MADEVLKIITLADTSAAVASFKQLDQTVQKFSGATKTAVTAASQSFGKMKDELLAGPKAALEGLVSSVEKQKTAFQAALPSAEEYSKSLKEMGKHLGDIGKSLTIGLTVPLTAAAAALIATGVSFDAAFDKIRGKTGATGASLESLKDSFRTVLGSVPQNADQVSSVLVSLNQRLGLTGTSLEALAKTELDLARVTGENVQGIVVATTQAFENWHIATAEQIPTLDTLLKISQATGIGVTQLADSVGKFGPQFRAVGFSFNEAAVLVGKFEREGVGAEQLIRGINRAVVELGKRGQSPKEVFQGLIEGIKQLDDQKAVDVASKFFGARGAVALVDAVKSGRFEIDALLRTIQDSGETVKKAGDDTLSFADKFEILRNKVGLALEPLGTSLLNILEQNVFPAIESGIGKLKGLADIFGSLPVPVQEFVFGLGGLLAILGPTISGLGFMLDGISKFVGFLPTATALLTASGGFLPAIALGTVLLGGFAVAYSEIGRQQQTNDELKKTVDIVQRLSGVAKQSGITPDQFSALRAAAEREASQLGSTKTADQLFEEKINAASAARRTAGALGGVVPISLSPVTAGAKTTNASKSIIPSLLSTTTAAAEKPIDPEKFDREFRTKELGIFETFDRAGDQFDKSWTARLRGTADRALQALKEEEAVAKELEEKNKRAAEHTQALEDKLNLLRARNSGGSKQQGEVLELLEQQRQDRRGVSGRDLEIINATQQEEQLALVTRQYDETFAKIQAQAEGVFDAIFLRGKKGFAGLLDYIKGIFITQLKDAFGKLVATLFAGPRPGGSRQEGGIFGGLLSGIQNLFGGNRQAAGGGGGGFNPAQLLGFGGGGGGTGAGGGAAALAGFAPAITKDAFGNYALGAGGAAGTAGGGGGGAGGLAAGAGQFGSIGKFLSGGFSGGLGTAGALTAGIGGGFLGGFGTGRALQIGNTRSAIAGGIGAGVGAIATAFLGPQLGALVGAAAGALSALGLRLLFGKAREAIFAKEIQRDFGILVKDGKLLKQIKNIGESQFGKDANKKRFETLRLNDVQSLLLNYATASGQDPSRLPIYQKFFGNSNRSISFDPSKGIPAFASGTSYVPQTGLAIVHQGEAIIPASQNANGGGITVNAPLTINMGNGDPKEVERHFQRHKREIVRALEGAVQGDYRRQNILGGLIGN